MKKTNTILLAVVVLVTVFAIGCKKNSTKSKTDLLTQKPWKPISFLQDGTEEIDSCGLDDVYTFSSNGTATLNVGADDCGGDETSGSFAWKFIDNETKMIIDGDTAVVTQLDDNTLKLTYDWDGVFIETYKH